MGIEGDPRARRQEHSPERLSWLSTKRLEGILSDLVIPTPLRDRILRRAENEASEGIMMADKPADPDEYLRAVTRRVFNFSISELSPVEIREIEAIRRDLGIEGEFNPSK